MENRIKRLEGAVVIISLLFILSIFISIYTITQIKMIAKKIPDYTEIKNDMVNLKKAYTISGISSDSSKVKINNVLRKSGEIIQILKK